MAPRSITTDILIIGAGPAGSTLARNLSSRYSVTLVDPRRLDHPSPFPDKPCGGLIAPAAQNCLLQMGLALPANLMVSPQAFGVRVIDLESRHTRLFTRDYINIDRGAFDRWLFTLAALNSNVRPILGTRLQSFTQHQTGVNATLLDGTQIEAKVIIGADGARSKVRNCLGDYAFGLQRVKVQLNWECKGRFSCSGYRADRPDNIFQATQESIQSSLEHSWFGSRRNLAVQQWFHVDGNIPEHGSYFHSKVTREYAWSIPKDGYLLVGTTMPWPEEKGQRATMVKERMHILAEGLRRHGYQLGELHHTESCPLLSPGIALSFPLGKDRALLIGEAAGLVSPSSAEGFSYAFKSAMHLANLLNEQYSLTHDAPSLVYRYGKQLRSVTLNLRSKWLKALVLYNPTLRRAALASGIGSAARLW